MYFRENAARRQISPLTPYHNFRRKPWAISSELTSKPKSKLMFLSLHQQNKVKKSGYPSIALSATPIWCSTSRKDGIAHNVKESKMYRPYLDCVQDSDELSRLGIENILLERLVRKLWRLHKLQQRKIEKLLCGRGNNV